MKSLSDMTAAELKQHLAALQDNLQEIEEERLFVLSQTGMHVSGKTVKNYEDEVSVLRKNIEQAQNEMTTKTE